MCPSRRARSLPPHSKNNAHNHRRYLLQHQQQYEHHRSSGRSARKRPGVPPAFTSSAARTAAQTTLAPAAHDDGRPVYRTALLLLSNAVDAEGIAPTPPSPPRHRPRGREGSSEAPSMYLDVSERNCIASRLPALATRTRAVSSAAASRAPRSARGLGNTARSSQRLEIGLRGTSRPVEVGRSRDGSAGGEEDRLCRPPRSPTSPSSFSYLCPLSPPRLPRSSFRPAAPPPSSCPLRRAGGHAVCAPRGGRASARADGLTRRIKDQVATTVSFPSARHASWENPLSGGPDAPSSTLSRAHRLPHPSPHVHGDREGLHWDVG
ncbi:hypothetical protein B0H13DRAFT_179193 [Mycena leptocephala]|nr:hypothetical protein B0H13DRAFT_179193 [Mycena leptocephala]